MGNNEFEETIKKEKAALKTLCDELNTQILTECLICAKYIKPENQYKQNQKIKEKKKTYKLSCKHT